MVTGHFFSGFSQTHFALLQNGHAQKCPFSVFERQTQNHLFFNFYRIYINYVCLYKLIETMLCVGYYFYTYQTFASEILGFVSLTLHYFS